MKKTLLTLATVVAASFLSMAADCSDSAVVACAEDTDCGDGEICAAEVCITPVCEVDADCDLQNVGEGSPVFSPSELDAGNDACEDEDFVTIVGFDEQEYCAVDIEAGECGAGEVETPATLKAGGSVTVCTLDDGVCTDGSCG